MKVSASCGETPSVAAWELALVITRRVPRLALHARNLAARLLAIGHQLEQPGVEVVQVLA